MPDGDAPLSIIVAAQVTSPLLPNKSRRSPLGVVGVVALMVIAPALFTTLLLGAVPLGDPRGVQYRDYWAAAAVVVPSLLCVVGYTHVVALGVCGGERRPFGRGAVWAAAAAWVACAVAAHAAVPLAGWFNLNGLFYLALTAAVCYLWAWLKYRHRQSPAVCGLLKSYCKVAAVLFSFALVLVGYVFTFRHVRASRQFVLPFALSISVFVFRKAVLHLTDPFPLETAMLISGLWVESMADAFQVMALPSVKSMYAFIVMWCANFLGIIANLVFFSHWWFSFRVWIKSCPTRVGVLVCRMGGGGGGSSVTPPLPPPSPPPLPSPQPPSVTGDNPDDRGHSNCMPGYHRRQSGACVMYVCNSGLLRLGRNGRYFPFTVLPPHTYRLSVVYSCGCLLSVLLSGLFAWALLRRWRPSASGDVREKYAVLIGDTGYVAFACLLLVCCSTLALTFVLYHVRLWYTYLPPLS
eukprot:TRINITY_DN2371_c0_g1_i2.p1 TRINITY_DN2371_c0_g1~~TRINITY_DN2371_c0_g1_i2.p1  ORF type:complete len:465 (-),score=97.58 TRINITY_DN2371_c0_g1_i2:160-1554(-)